MRILLSNDDGYLAPGIACLYKALKDKAEITVVAPARNRSGASNSLTLDSPLRATETDNGFISVEGTPTDCVHLAITGLLDEEPDMVIAGINAGANLGDDVLYSGTVAAAVEGRFLGLPAIAVSLCGDSFRHYESAAQAVEIIIEQLAHEPLPANTILNINVPDLPWSSIKGFIATRLGHRHKAEPVYRDKDPRGKPIFWVGPPGEEQDAGPGTDFHAIANDSVSVSPLQIDMTHYESLEVVASWLKGVKP
ncbi:MAG: 5'/3'-nucleotidase SurE [Sulfuriflexus sp.]|nr:5'/3'-nucleotidase SurE [Sulfuriflexus sp.]